MKIGFTGTRDGMTPAQKLAFARLLIRCQPTEFHHGDCVGSDDEAASGIKEARPDIRIVCHPPLDESLRAFNPCHAEIRPAKSHFARNRAIVNGTEILIATPREMSHQPRGGTWYTVDFARKLGRTVYVVYPDGSVEVSG